ncbi:thiamine phosphate synthase [Chloroflexota bacterium]
MFAMGSRLKNLCEESGVPFILNDRLDMAVAVDADGVHLGQNDLPTRTASKLLPLNMLIGCSTANLEEAFAAQAEGADYIAVGSIYPAGSKADTRTAGLETLRRIKAQTPLPVVAIGGINGENIADVMDAGADVAAVIGAVLGVDDVQSAVRELVAVIARCPNAEGLS